MKIVNEQLLSELRVPGRCEWCKGWSVVRHPHHLWARGLGGGSRLDVAINLISLCPFCHRECHDGHIARIDLLLIVAAREECMQSDIEKVIYWLRELPKDVSPDNLAWRLAHMAPGAGRLASKVIQQVRAA